MALYRSKHVGGTSQIINCYVLLVVPFVGFNAVYVHNLVKAFPNKSYPATRSRRISQLALIGLVSVCNVRISGMCRRISFTGNVERITDFCNMKFICK
jgi:hypothetical protein